MNKTQLNLKGDTLTDILKQNNLDAPTQKALSALRYETVDKLTFFVGTGTCGLGAGAGKSLNKLKAVLAEKNIDADVIEVGCIGLCVDEPLIDVQTPEKTRVSFKKITEDKVESLVDAVSENKLLEDRAIVQFRNAKAAAWDDVPFIDEHPFFAPQTRWVLKNCGLVNPENIDEYIARGGYRGMTRVLNEVTPADFIDEAQKAGIKGRGGGGFPIAMKWKFAYDVAAEQKYYICNADEGDPGAFMDRAIIEGDPFRLLEGLTLASYAIGASKAYIYIRAEYPLAIERLHSAIKSAKEYGLLGQNILDSGYNLDIIIKKGAGAFVCGEETALMHSIEGKRGMPRPRPPFPTNSGLFQKPTVINNVETLANLPGFAANGADWFNSIGTEFSKGTKVFALSGKIVNTGLVEVAMGTRLREIIFDVGGGIPDGKAYKAVQIGGPSGGCIPAQHLDIEIDYQTLQGVGAMMGSGGLVVMDETTCMVDIAKYFMAFIQRESCGKCIPCREGTSRMLEILERITSGRKSENENDALERFKGVMYLNRLAEVIKDTSLCGLGKSAPNPVLSTLRWFKDEYEAHIYDRKCPAGQCVELLEYSIDADACIGCTLCAKNCPADAIMGSPKTPHYIIPEKCIQCGSCVDVCRVNAVLVN